MNGWTTHTRGEYVTHLEAIPMASWSVKKVVQDLTIVSCGDDEFDMALHKKGTHQIAGHTLRVMTSEQRARISKYVQRIRAHLNIRTGPHRTI